MVGNQPSRRNGAHSEAMTSSRVPSRPGLRTTASGGTRGVGERVDRVERIAVVQAGGLSELLLTFPAMEGLRAAYPAAEMALLTTSANRELLAPRTGPWTSLVTLPPAVTAASRRRRGSSADTPPAAQASADTRRTLQSLSDTRFDIGIQLTVDSRSADDFLLHLGARVSAGTSAHGAEGFDRAIEFVPLQHTTLRALEIVSLVGAQPAALAAALPILREDRDRARHLIRPLSDGGRPLLALHPGGSDPRHRWPTGWFGEIAARAATGGWRVVVLGSEQDGRLARDLIGQAVSHGADCRRILDLTGRTDLSDLIGIADAADVLVGNDSGPLHIAEAVGTPSVGIFWVGGSITSAPLSRRRHRVHIGWTTSCPICGKDATQALWTGDSCDHEPSFVTAVPVAPVWDDVEELVAETRQEVAPQHPDAFVGDDTGAFDLRDLDDY